MINIFDRKTSYKEALISNGVYDLTQMMISAETTEDIFGNYELNMEIELQGDAPTELYEMLQVDNIIKVNDEGSDELFRIAQVNKGLDFIEVYCRHITISDSLNLWLDNVKPTNLNGNAALQWLNARTNPKSELIFSSNIAKVSTADYVRKNLYEALFEGDNAFIKRWGGEVKRTRQTITIDSKLGQDKSEVIKIKEALNLTGFNANSNIDEVSTVIYPIGFDGITAPRIESPLKDNYSMEFPIEIKYEDVKVKKQPEEGQEPTEQDQEGYDTLEEAQAELTRRAKAEFTDNHLDKIKFECDIDYIDLEKYEEYKDITALQTAFLGDTIAVRVDTFDMDIKARVVARQHDILKNRRIKQTISTEGTLKKPENIKDIIKDIIGSETAPEIWEGLGPYIDQMIQAGFKNGYIVYEKNAVYAVDKLPKEKARNVVVLNKNGLGYSSTGIGGPYKYGFTIDGKLNADMITTGTLHGQYIGAGTIEANKLSVKAKNEIKSGMATSQQFIDLTADVSGLKSTVAKVDKKATSNTTSISSIQQTADGLTSTVAKVETTVNGQNTKISKIEQKANKIELSVGNKVNNNEIISSINLSPEKVKIKASKVEIEGEFITKSNLTDGVTKISGDNIQTGTIDGMRFRGTELFYMAANGTMACDGNTYIKNFRVPETYPGWSGIGTFSCGPSAFFDKSIYAKDWIYTDKTTYGGGRPVVASHDAAGKWLDVKGVCLTRNYSGMTSLIIKPWNNDNEYWVEIHLSDKNLKENIQPLDYEHHKGANKIGLDLINSIKHCTYNFKEFTETIDCGYIAQDLWALNHQIVDIIQEGEPQETYKPRLDAIMPNITLAIQQQQKYITELEKRIAALEAKQNV